MHIEIELALEVVGAEFSEAVDLLAYGHQVHAQWNVLSFVPGHDWRQSDLPEPRK